MADENWYQSNNTQPDKEQPWYHVLVNDGHSITYVAEQNLESDKVGGPIDHPEVQYWFEPLTSDHYNIRMRRN